MSTAQYVEPAELRMLRRSMDATFDELRRIELALLMALDDTRRALERTRMNAAWVACVDVQISSEART